VGMRKATVTANGVEGGCPGSRCVGEGRLGGGGGQGWGVFGRQ
jgi:hypothetical protein